MGGVSGPAPLAPFACNWVGGDIHGLSALAGTLYGYAPKVTDVANALDSQVRNVVNAAGWQGDAASAFSTAWGHDSMTARAVGIASDQVGGTVDWLAVRLSQVESALEKYADEARGHGVSIGEDGMPPEACFGPPASAAEADAQKWATWYQETWQNCMDAAKTARQAAAAGLSEFCEGIVGKDGMNGADANTAGDLLADLLAVPSAYSRDVAKDLAGIRANARNIINDSKAILDDGDTLPRSLLDEIQASKSELRSGDAALTTAKSNETTLSKLLDTRVKDVLPKSGDSEPGGLADSADDDAGALSKLVDFGEDIPVVDLLAGAVGTGLGAYGDIQNGQAWYEAVPEEAVANYGGVAAGALAGGAVAGAVGGGLVGGVLGVGAAGVVAYGVGDFAHNLFEQNWSADIHQHGVIGGVADGIGNSAVQTGKDFVHTATDIGHTAEHIWDSVF